MKVTLWDFIQEVLISNLHQFTLYSDQVFSSVLGVHSRFQTHTHNWTVRGPCIMIHSYNKGQRDALFLKFILIENSTFFGTDLLSIIRSLNTIHSNRYLSWQLC